MNFKIYPHLVRPLVILLYTVMLMMRSKTYQDDVLLNGCKNGACAYWCRPDVNESYHNYSICTKCTDLHVCAECLTEGVT